MKNLKFLLLFTAALLSFSSCKKNEQQSFNGENNLTNASSKTNIAAIMYTQANWMGDLPDTKSISLISIPGTHDSGARVEPVSGTAKCQNLTIAEQLNAGVRYLDIRCRHVDNSFAIHHGSVYQNLNFQDVLNACNTFLNSNPTETIIMSVKEEHTPSNNTRSFEQTFDSYVQQNASRWELSAAIPTLGQVRNKIKLLRRFGSGNVKGIDATNWADNTTFEINNSSGIIKIQDYYNVSDLNKKWTDVESMLNQSRNDASNRLYINYGSGYKAGWFGIPNINTVANHINPRISTYLTNNTKGKFGIIPLDFIDANRSNLILRTNF